MSFNTTAGIYTATQMGSTSHALRQTSQAYGTQTTRPGAQAYTGRQHTGAQSRIDGAFQSTSAYSSSWQLPQSAGNGAKTYCPQDFLQASGQLIARATGSFTDMNSQVVSGTIEELNSVEEPTGLMRIKRPDSNPIGQVTPVGDALLPLLLMAAGYCLFKRVRLKRN